MHYNNKRMGIEKGKKKGQFVTVLRGTTPTKFGVVEMNMLIRIMFYNIRTKQAENLSQTLRKCVKDQYDLIRPKMTTSERQLNYERDYKYPRRLNKMGIQEEEED